MSTITAQVLVGRMNPNHNGINPTHLLCLSENSRPALILLDEDLSSSRKKRNRSVWIPTIEDMVNDIMLMIGALVLKDKKIVDIIKNYLKEKNLNNIELSSDFQPQDLKELYAANKEIMKNYKDLKVTLSVFDESSLENKLSTLKDYDINIEVCVSKYLRFFSDWSKKVIIDGDLR